MTAASITARGQRAAERLMTDSCTIDRPTGDQTTDAHGRVTEEYVVPSIYTGKCRVQSGEDRAQTPEVGSSTPTLQGLEVHVPVGAGPFEVGDVVTIGARVLRVTGTHVKTFQTAQRLSVEEA